MALSVEATKIYKISHWATCHVPIYFGENIMGTYNECILPVILEQNLQLSVGNNNNKIFIYTG